jgi:hypothetical protein
MANAKRATRKTPKTTRRPMAKRKPPELAVDSTGKDIYLVHNGIRIAKRGGPGTPQEKTWILIEPGYEVYESDDFCAVVIDQFKPPIH